MFSSDYSELIKTLTIPGHERTDEEQDYIFAFLRGIDELKHYREALLKSIAWIIRHEYYETNQVVYSNGSRVTCWYILLSGCIFLDGKLYFPTTCFGRRIGKDTIRREDCICLDACDLLVVDTPDLESRPVTAVGLCSNSLAAPGDGMTSGERIGHARHLADSFIRACELNSKRMSHSSDTSSAYSGSGELDSSVQNCDSDEDSRQADAESAVQLTPEPARRSPLLAALEKDPGARSSDDIEILLEAFQRLHAFANFTQATQRQFAACMLYAVVENAGQVVLDDGEKLDSWSVIVDGEVEVSRPGSAPLHLRCGDAFGVRPSSERQHHVGVMRSLVRHCRFAFVTQEHYCRILAAEADNEIEVRGSDGALQLVKEVRTLDSGTLKKLHAVIRGTPAALIDQLLEVKGDSGYVDDFLLTYRTFLDSGVPVAQRLLAALANPETSAKAVRVFLMWTNNHFEDFEKSRELFELLLQFERQLAAREDTRGAQGLLRLACSTKSERRQVAFQPTGTVKFLLAEGACFVKELDDSDDGGGGGLRVADQILEVNHQPVRGLGTQRLLQLLHSATRLELLVRWDPLRHHELLASVAASRHSSASANASPSSSSSLSSSGRSQQQQQQQQQKGGSWGRFAGKGRSPKAVAEVAEVAEELAQAPAQAALKTSASNPDLASSAPELPDHVVRVFRPPKDSKLLSIHRETTAHEVVMLAMQEFGLAGASCEYKLLEVSVQAGPLVRRRTLFDGLQDLAARLPLNARYYVKHQQELADQFLSDADAQEVLNEAAVDFLQLDPQDVAYRLTVDDFEVFRRILPSQLVDWWYKKELASKEFNDFSQLTEKESMWPVNELTCEQNAGRRVRLLKHFLKVNQHCRQLNNLNSVMSITLGLAKSQNSQLNPAWDKLPKKYKDLWKSFEKLTDISMNHASYRQLMKAEKFQPPALPYLPILCKDLTAIRECDERVRDGLVNFEKLRLLAREVRSFCRFAQADYAAHCQLPARRQHPHTLRRAGSSSGLNSNKRRSTALTAVAKKLYDESVLEKKLCEYVGQLRQLEADRAISQCPELPATAGTKFNAASEQQFNRLLALSEGRRPAKHQHIPAPPPQQPAASARPPLPPPYQQVMQQRQQLAPAPQPPPRSDTTVATAVATAASAASARPAAPPPYHQAVARREQLG